MKTKILSSGRLSAALRDLRIQYRPVHGELLNRYVHINQICPNPRKGILVSKKFIKCSNFWARFEQSSCT
jgi:hypothetical protein